MISPDKLMPAWDWGYTCGAGRWRLDVHGADARADAAQNIVRDRTRHLSDLLRILRNIAFCTKQRHVVAGAKLRGVAQVDRGQIHRDGPEDCREPAGRDHGPAIGEAVEDAIRVSRAKYADPHRARRAER